MAKDTARLTRRKNNDINKRTDHLIELADAILDSNDDSFDVSKIDSRIRKKNQFAAIFEKHFVPLLIFGIIVFFVGIFAIDYEVGGFLVQHLHGHLKTFHEESTLEQHKGTSH